MKNPTNIEFFIDAAKTHGIDSEPDHEVGDLQDMLRAAWDILTPAQRMAFVSLPAIEELVENCIPDIDYDEARESLIAAQVDVVNDDNGASLYDRITAKFPGFITDDDVNGGDLVDWVSQNLDTIKNDSINKKFPKP